MVFMFVDHQYDQQRPLVAETRNNIADRANLDIEFLSSFYSMACELTVMYYCKGSNKKYLQSTIKIFSVNLYKEYTSLKSRELEELPRFRLFLFNF